MGRTSGESPPPLNAEEQGVCLWCASLGRGTNREMNEAERQAMSRQSADQPASPDNGAPGASDPTCLYGLLKQRAAGASGDDLLRAIRSSGSICPEWRRHQDGQSPGTAFRAEQERQTTDLMEEMLAWTRRHPRLAATVGIAGVGLTGALLWLALWQ